jgi:selenocysteine-specific elongation factor
MVMQQISLLKKSIKRNVLVWQEKTLADELRAWLKHVEHILDLTSGMLHKFLMRSVVIGTAGHIDHGKTTLVKALTGVDTDRLEEEKRRGITIELGFAKLDLGENLQAGIVDVPGHERFIKNMVAGTSGIDIVLMVVAADEGVMPQTREHLDICGLLGVEHGVIALTKTDLAEDRQWLEMVTEDLREEFSGTFLSASPIVPVSARTGEGLTRLRTVLAGVAAEITATESDSPTFLAIDRAFSMKGFGTVVTGSLVAGELATDDLIDILPDPAGKMRSMKIRGLQVHGENQERVSAGHRLAINLSNVDRGALSRGQVVVRTGTLEAGRSFEGRLRLVPGAKAVKSRSRAVFHVGTARCEAAVLLIGRDSIGPGENCYACIQCAEPVAALPGQRFILRGFSPVPGRGTTMGGGKILAILPPRRRRRDEQAWLAELALLEKGSLEERILILLEHAGVKGLGIPDLCMRLGTGAGTVSGKLDGLMAKRQVFKFDRERGRYLARSVLDDLGRRAEKLLSAFHADNPLLPGMPLEQVRGSLARDLDPRLFKLLIHEQHKAGRMIQQEEVLRSSRHQVELDADGTRLGQKVLEAYTGAGLAPPRPSGIADQLGQPEPAVLDMIRHFARQGLITHISGEMYVPTAALDDLRERLIAYLGKNGSIDTQGFKNLVGSSRKHVIPLAEFFDREKTTIRKGEQRVLRKKNAWAKGGENVSAG